MSHQARISPHAIRRLDSLLWGLLATAIGIATPAYARNPCNQGRYIVDGPGLIDGARLLGPDHVAVQPQANLTLEEPLGPKSLRPHISVDSGCPQTPTRLRVSSDRTHFDVRFPGCGVPSHKARLRGIIDPTCTRMTGVLLLPKGGRRPFTAHLENNPNNRVNGIVSIDRGGRNLTLPNVMVELRDPTSGEPVAPAVPTDADGHYQIPAQPNGTYSLCARAVGFQTKCDSEPVVFPQPDSSYLVRDLKLDLDGNGIDGRVLLADGAVCFHRRTFAGPYVAGAVARFGVADLGVQVNSKGEYVLPGLMEKGPISLVATCGDAQGTFEKNAGDAELAGRTTVDLVFDNHAPQITALFAHDNAGNYKRSANPGDVLIGEARAADPDGDTLHYYWYDEYDKVVSVDAPQVSWPLMTVESTNGLYLEVTDGKGGFARRRIVVNTSPTGDRIFGKVVDERGNPVAAVGLLIDDKQARTDEDGNFQAAVQERERHILRLHKRGYVPIVRAWRGSTAGMDLQLVPAVRNVIEARDTMNIADPVSGLSIEIPAGGLINELREPPTGGVDADVSVMKGDDPNLVPGDGSARGSRSEPAVVRPASAVWLELSDDDGHHYNLAPGVRARVSFPAGAAETAPSAKLYHFDEAAAEWVEAGAANLHDGRYEAFVESFSAWAIGIPFGETTCLRVHVNEFAMALPFYMEVSTHPVFDPKTTKHGTFKVTEIDNVLEYLPMNSVVNLDITPIVSPNNVKSYSVALTGNTPVAAIDQQEHYNDWCPEVVVQQSLPANSWLYRNGFGSESDALDYYASIGAPLNFPLWLAQNNFPADAASNDVSFVNPNEIGLGRRVNCQQSAGRVACYVTKYGHVGDDPTVMLANTIGDHDPGDTVAMEFSPPPNGGDPIVKFFIFGPDGLPKTHTAFDTEGDIKYVPNVCTHCHGGAKYKFNVLDPTLYIFDQSGPNSLTAKQERVRQLNQAVAHTYFVNLETDYIDWLNSIYPTGWSTPGSVAQPAPPPASDWAGHEIVWDKIVKPQCRTCHIYQGGLWGFKKQFAALPGGHMIQDICTGMMPHAMSPQLNIWKGTDDENGPNPFLPLVLTNHLDLAGCYGWGSGPSLEITSPTDGSNVATGGLNFVNFTANVSDVQDGDECCSVQWKDGDKVLGYGKSLQATIDGAGDHVITATATDKDGQRTSATVTITGENDPPQMTILKPTIGQDVYLDVPIQLQGTSFDATEPLFEIPCANFVWTTQIAGDPVWTGCNVTVTFTTPETRILTLTGTDSDGQTGYAIRTFEPHVPNVFLPPQVLISKPNDNSYVDPYASLQLSAIVTDPTGNGGPITYAWKVDGTMIGSSLNMNWTPSSLIPFHCGGTSAVITLEATNSHGTGTAQADIYVGYDPC